jgi:hypothetical protein
LTAAAFERKRAQTSARGGNRAFATARSKKYVIDFKRKSRRQLNFRLSPSSNEASAPARRDT